MTHQPFFYPSAIFCLLSLPLVLSLVPPNRLYGIRTPKTLANEQVWYRANRFGGWLFLASGAAYLAFATLFPMTGNHDPRFTLWLAHLALFLLPLVASLIGIMRFVRRR